MFCDEKYQKNNRSRDIQRFTDNTRGEIISFNSMDDKKHGNNCDYNSPARICRDASKHYRYAADKNTENRDKTGQESDTSQRENIGEDIVSTQ